ncbi:MAG: GTPase domain-containing protein [Arcanobacterium sp.]|nr:GTPase domain-containing protein [Arcanobacterium sp.]
MVISRSELPSRRQISERTMQVRIILQALRDAKFPLELPGTYTMELTRDNLITQLESRVIPQLMAAQLPVIIVVGGSSGAGKSTLVNSLLQEEVTEASILRPTTRIPAVIIHPNDERMMRNHPILEGSKVVVTPAAAPGVVLIDAPDLDSIEVANHELSRRLVESADFWIFTTTASRYGDAVAWEALESAFRRGLTCAVLLNRLPQRAADPVRKDLLARLSAAEMHNVPLFVVPDLGPMEGLLEPEVITEISQWLEMVSRAKLARRLSEKTSKALLPAIREDLLLLADGLEAQENSLISLHDKALEGGQAAITKLITNIEAGRFGQGAPSASWLALASTGGPLASLVSGKKSVLFAKRRRQQRDAAMQQLFDAVLASAQVALKQGVISAQAGVEQAWADDVVETQKFVQVAQGNLNLEQIVDEALTRWRISLRSIGKNLPKNPWLGVEGLAALIGSAAGGISGVVKVAQDLDLEEEVRQARKVLAATLRQAVESVARCYQDSLAQIKVSDSTILRLRASELLDKSEWGSL